MKILLVNKFHYLNGGSEKYYFELGKLLKEHGNEVAYFSMKDDRNIKAPVKYDTLKRYCISNLLKDEDVDKAFLWIILKLSVTYNFMTNKLTD